MPSHSCKADQIRKCPSDWNENPDACYANLWDQQKGHKNAPPHAILRTFSVLHGDCDTASHTQSQQDRSQKDHQCIRRSDCCQRIRSQNATCHPCVGVLYLCCSRLPDMSGREILCFCRNESTCKILRKYPYFVNSVITSLITLPSALPFRCGITVFMI